MSCCPARWGFRSLSPCPLPSTSPPRARAVVSVWHPCGTVGNKGLRRGRRAPRCCMNLHLVGSPPLVHPQHSARACVYSFVSVCVCVCVCGVSVCSPYTGGPLRRGRREQQGAWTAGRKGNDGRCRGYRRRRRAPTNQPTNTPTNQPPPSPRGLVRGPDLAEPRHAKVRIRRAPP